MVETLATILIVTVLAVVLLPAGMHALEKSRSVTCIANLKIISSALNIYAAENQGRLPPHNAGGTFVSWAGAVEQAAWASPAGRAGFPDIRCPSGRSSQAVSTYNYNTRWYTSSSNWAYDIPKPLASINQLSKCIVVYCNWWDAWPTSGKAVGDPNTHVSGRNVLYADGHMEIRKDYVEPGRLNGTYDGIEYVNGIPLLDLKSN